MTELQVYQTVHLAAGEPRFLKEHLALLHEAACELFNRPILIESRKIERGIRQIVLDEKYHKAATAFVRIACCESGRVVLSAEGCSLYEGYALRSVHPDAVTLEYELPMHDLPTSAAEAVLQEARCAARIRGAELALRCDRNGRCMSIEGHPVVGIYGNRLIAPRVRREVEHDLLLRAAAHLGLDVAEISFTRRDLNRFEEILWADHRGITALGHIDGLPLMALTAEKLGAAMELLMQQ